MRALARVPAAVCLSHRRLCRRTEHNIDCVVLYKPSTKKKPNVLDYMRGTCSRGPTQQRLFDRLRVLHAEGKVDLVINIPANVDRVEVSGEQGGYALSCQGLTHARH